MGGTDEAVSQPLGIPQMPGFLGNSLRYKTFSPQKNGQKKKDSHEILTAKTFIPHSRCLGCRSWRRMAFEWFGCSVFASYSGESR